MSFKTQIKLSQQTLIYSVAFCK